MAVNRMFRTDPATGLVFHEPAEKLMRWNAVAAVVSLLVGGLLAIGVVLTRWQAVHLLPAACPARAVLTTAARAIAPHWP